MEPLNSKRKEPVIIQEASFNKEVKTYILLYVAIILASTIVGILALPFWFLGLGQYYAKRYYEHLFCTLTERSLHYKKGVLIQTEKTIPLENIQDLTFVEGPILRWLNLNIIKIETAGTSGNTMADMKLVGIKDSVAFKTLVLEQREEFLERKQKHLEGPSDHDTIQVLQDIKSILGRIESALSQSNKPS
jgi:putative membrane protein